MLVLYRELAGYFIHCMNELAEKHSVEIDIVAWPINDEAPFQFHFSEGIRVYNRKQTDDSQIDYMISKNGYNLIFCGGWIDKGYLSIVQDHPRIPSLLGFDKQWTGSMRDRLVAWKNRFSLPRFDYAFVPGPEQVQFARQLGFSKEKIVDGAYTCELSKFNEVYQKRKQPNQLLPRKIWFTGRYVDAKGIDTLCNVMAELLESTLADWELHCAGTGPLRNALTTHPKIVHHGFLQADEIREHIADGEIFILPSRYEPWGVVVHEFAAAGYALILSDHVGARFSFLEHGKNGLIFQIDNKKALKEAILQLTSKSREELRGMGDKSHALAQKINPTTYAHKIIEMMKKEA
jgi:glycosyltransferase involved in cell wall biosynthesis